MDKDGMNTATIKRNLGEEELTSSIGEAFDKLEKEGTDLGRLVPSNTQQQQVSDKTGRKTPPQPEETVEDEPDDEEEKKPDPEPEKDQEPDDTAVSDEPEDEEEEGGYDLEKIKKLASLEEEEKQAKQPEKSRADDDDAKLEIEEIQKNPHTPEKTKKGIERLLGNNNRLKKVLDDERTKREALEKRLAEIEGDTSKATLTDSERHELNMLRMKHNIGSDDTIKKTFDQPIETAENKIYKIVDRILEPDQAKQVRELGFENFARKMPRAYRELVDLLEDKSPLDASVLQHSVTELLRLKEDRQQEIEKLTQNADEYFSNVAKTSKEKEEKQRKFVQQIRDQTYQELIEKDVLFSQIDENGLSGEQLKIAQRENKRRNKYRDLAKRMIHAATIEEQQEIIYRAALSSRLADTVKDLQSQLDALKGDKGRLARARSLKRGREEPTAPKDTERKPASFEEALDGQLGSPDSAENIFRSTRSVPR